MSEYLDNQLENDEPREIEPRCCYSCGRPLTNGEVGDQCEQCHWQDHDRRDR